MDTFNDHTEQQINMAQLKVWSCDHNQQSQRDISFKNPIRSQSIVQRGNHRLT